MIEIGVAVSITVARLAAWGAAVGKPEAGLTVVADVSPVCAAAVVWLDGPYSRRS
jgi:hypothetical protein